MTKGSRSLAYVCYGPVKNHTVFWPLDAYPMVRVNFFFKYVQRFFSATPSSAKKALDILKFCFNPDRWICIQRPESCMIFNRPSIHMLWTWTHDKISLYYYLKSSLFYSEKLGQQKIWTKYLN